MYLTEPQEGASRSFKKRLNKLPTHFLETEKHRDALLEAHATAFSECSRMIIAIDDRAQGLSSTPMQFCLVDHKALF